MFIARAICGIMCKSRRLGLQCSLPKYLERWPAALYEAGWSVLMKRSKTLRTELNTVHLYQHYSLYIPNKLQYTWRGDYCECVCVACRTVLTEVWASSLLEQYLRYVPHWDRAGYNGITRCQMQGINTMKQTFDLHAVHTTILQKNNIYQPHSNNIHQLYNIISLARKTSCYRI